MEHVERQTGTRREQVGYIGLMLGGPIIDLADLAKQHTHQIGAGLREGHRRQIKLRVPSQAGGIGQHAGLHRRLPCRQIRVPDHPRVNASAGEGGAAIGGRKIDRLNIAELQSRPLQRSDQ